MSKTPFEIRVIVSKILSILRSKLHHPQLYRTRIVTICNSKVSNSNFPPAYHIPEVLNSKVSNSNFPPAYHIQEVLINITKPQPPILQELSPLRSV
jgi:hypothetical protein